MFRRLIAEGWVLWVPAISFIIFFTIFMVVTIRALRLSKAERKRLASLPLDQSDNPPSEETTSQETPSEKTSDP